jgi:hypothetical protein
MAQDGAVLTAVQLVALEKVLQDSDERAVLVAASSTARAPATGR